MNDDADLVRADLKLSIPFGEVMMVCLDLVERMVAIPQIQGFSHYAYKVGVEGKAFDKEQAHFNVAAIMYI